jgi:type I restriction enzyme S subunit
MAEWSLLPFEQLLLEPVRNGIYKPKQFHGRGCKIVNMGELFGHPRLRAIPMKRVELNSSELQRFSLAEGDLIFARRSLTAEGAGKCSIVLELDDDTTFESSIIRARPDPSKASSLFLYYFFNSPTGFHKLDTIRRQVAVAGITGADLSKLKIPVPAIEEQREIVSILGALDDKIDLNRCMNETLEAAARAIFKDWFVNFGPTRAKLDSRAPYLAPEIWALFPDRLNDKGKPDGWRLTVIEDVLDELETGGRPKGGVSGYTSGVPSVGAESIVGLGKFDYTKTKYIPKEFFDGINRGHVKSRDVLLYKDGGRPGEFEPHLTLFGDGFPFDTFAINEHVYRLRAKPDYGQALLYFWLSSDLAMEEMRIKGTGVAIPGLNSTQVKSLTTLVPASNVARAFDTLVEPVISRILANCNEAQSLAKLRDLLLPKLISGEIRAKNAEDSGGCAVAFGSYARGTCGRPN